MPIFLMFEISMFENVTLTTLPVALKSVLIRRPIVEFVTQEFWNLDIRSALCRLEFPHYSFQVPDVRQGNSQDVRDVVS